MRRALHNQVLLGDCISVMQRLATHSVDFVLTDPPYITRYVDRSGRSVINDDNGNWLEPAFQEAYRLLKPNCFCISFYGWNEADRFIGAWRAAGFRIVGHLVFAKDYASLRRFLAHHHEQAYLLAKGNPPRPPTLLPDVRGWSYTGNRLHPTQKPLEALEPLVAAYCPPGGVVLDPFCGSGSSLVAARRQGCRYLGIELDRQHHYTATQRLRGVRDISAMTMTGCRKQ